MRKIKYVEALREAHWEEMRRDDRIFMFGEGIGLRGGCFTQTRGMWPEFGAKRLIDVPLSEPGFTGLALAAAMTGLRPIVDIMFWDFANEVIGQIVNQAGRIHFMSNGQFNVPIVIHGVIGVGQSAGAHHSGRQYPIYTHMPGLKVILPATPYDVKGLLKTAIRDDDPVLVFLHKGLLNSTGEVPEEEYTIPFGQAAIRREGTDVTVVATSKMVLVAQDAAERLAGDGISVEVIDPRTLVPFDKETILDSVRKTNRLVVVDEAFSPCGVGAEIAALAADEAFYYLDSPIKRVHPPSMPAPSSPPLEQAMVLDVDSVINAVREVTNQ
ncbi:MAG: alpha-ketoacid dehydrogenase subunit beta [Anaerolineae bacterium]|nr:alpha-ketoacid dehydrogenase subunit beta [Anaerolineae bacterium]